MLERIVTHAIANELHIHVSSIDIDRTVDEDGNPVVQVFITLLTTPKEWKRGSMFDVVTTTARALREHGEVGIPYVIASLA